MVYDVIRNTIPNIEEFFLSEAIPFDYLISDPEWDFEFKLAGHQLSIYTEVWDAKRIRTKHQGIIIVNNSYLSSFAYNIAAVWVNYAHEYDQLKGNEDCQLARLLTYNLKKFFAEQIMRRSDCVFGSAIFLETLLYEEDLMVPVIKDADNNERIRTLYHELESLMSSLLLFHEIGHMVKDNLKEKMLPLMQQDAGLEMLGSYWSYYPDTQKVEFECDAFAVLSFIEQRKHLPLETNLRGVIFAFAVFAVLSSLDKSAEATAKQTPSSSEEDLDNFFNDMLGADFLSGTDELLKARAYSVKFICECVAEQNGIKLFEPCNDLLIHNDIIDVLLSFSLNIITRHNPPYRGKCEMLARALRGNPRGMRYLRLRSKKYSMPQNRSLSN